ncbi:MAG: MFS transporter [Phycisphaeraceae bacterium]
MGESAANPTGPAPAASFWQMVGWASFDWANSAFFTLIQTFVFANYFIRSIATDEAAGQTQWALAIGGAGAVVAVTGPLLGAVADQGGRRKPWIAGFEVLCLAATAALWWVKPDSPVWFALLLVAAGSFGLEAANIFYNAMLPELTHGQRLGRWSGWGWALGYAGGLACLAIALVALVGYGDGGLVPKTEARHVRSSFLLVAGWFALFSLPLFLVTPDMPGTGKRLGRAAWDGLHQLIDSARQIRQYGHIVRFLIARLFYIDGLASIFAIGGVYASGVFDMTASEIILLGIGLNVTAGIGAFSLAWLDDWIGAKWTIALSLVGILLPGSALVFIETEAWFWACALTLGFFVGPVQSASRSYLARVAPPGLRTQAFGLYAFSGKATAMAGPLLISAVTEWTGSQRWGITPIFGFLAVGLAILLTVPQADRAPAEPGS